MSKQPLFTEENHFMCVYILTSPSGKHYVGQARDYYDREKHRIQEYQRWLKIKDDENYSDIERRGANPRLFLAFLKYGIENFTAEILEENLENRERMDEREIYWIEHYDCLKNGYNVMEGGNVIYNIDPTTGRSTLYGKSKYEHNRSDERKEYNSEVYFSNHEENLMKHRAYRNANLDLYRNLAKKHREANRVGNANRRKFMRECDLIFFGDAVRVSILFRKIFSGGRTRMFNFITPKGLVNEQGCWLAE